MTQYIKKLPAVFQTVTERKFFDATFDQVFSKKDSDYLAGYIGRRDPGLYNPISDFYLPEPSKNRTWWQLEPTAYSRNAESEKTNIFFYDDLLERIEYYGGNTLNQDRLFESEYYSFGPPIDYDMFINYQNYYWVEQGLPTINISGVLAVDIIGQETYTTPPTATPPNLTLTTGMTILLVDDPDNLDPLIVENFGNCRGIGLVPQFPDFTSGTLFEFLPWDGVLELSNGRLINNQFWDATSWDTQAQPGYGDYITIERGSQDRNAWSRTNKWFHIDAITATVAVTNIAFPSNATRALRPIIQFIADLELYKSGTQFRDEIQYGFRDDPLGFPLLLSDYQDELLSTINSSLGIAMQDGDLVVFMNDTAPIVANYYPWDTANWDISPFTEWDAGDFTTLSHYIFQANLQGDGTINFAPYTSWATPVLEGDIVFITEDAPWDGARRGETWYFSGGIWQKAYNDKVSVNQAPLFLLYDHNGVTLDDPVTYPDSTFFGSEIFSYKVNPEPGATVDPVLRFPIIYTGLGQASDIIFQNNLITERYTYTQDRTDIDGYYYYKIITEPVLYNNWNLFQPCPCEENTLVTTYETFVAAASQAIFNTTLETLANTPTQSYLQVFVNGVFQREGVTGSYQVTGANQITFNAGLALNDDVVIFSSSELDIPPEYESAISLAAQTVFNTTLVTLPATVDKSFTQVYVNGISQLEGVTGSYQVTGANQITFNAGLALNDDVVIFGYSQVENPPNYDAIPALAAQTVFNTIIPTLPATNGQSYLQVLVNGVYQLEGTLNNFVVSGTNQITFNSPLSLNDDVVIFGVDFGATPIDCIATSKQRVIDKYAVGYGTEYQFKLSVTPYGYVIGGGAIQPLADVIVSVNSTEIQQFDPLTNPNGYSFIEINNTIYVDLQLYLTTLLTVTQAVVPVVEIQTYTHGLLDPAATGYFAIPQQLEANPTQLEVGEISASDLIPQFSSIIANQAGFTGIAFGGNNNYRDSGKNRTVGTFILQNVAPILKSMLVSSEDDLDFILAERFSQDEYTKFKNRYLSTAKQLINQEFSPVQYNSNAIVISLWVGEILRILNISKEFSNAFAYSYMAAQGSPFASQSFTGSGNSLVTLTDYADLNDPRNVLYVYDVTNPAQEQILVVGVDYEIVSTNLAIDVQLNLGVGIKDVYFTLYKEPIPTYIPSTPSKIGAYPIYIPRIELDATYVDPTLVIIGHDGSKTIAYGDYRDDLLLELEKRIYNGLQFRLRHQYYVPLRVESVESGYFRKTRYSRQEFLDITVSYLNKWSAKNRANYRTNEWPTTSLEPSVVPSFVPGVGNIWKLYNYTDAVTPLGVALDLPGNWKGIFQYYYDTYNPDTQPWNMLGFSDQPDWWQFEYGPPVLNLAGQEVWTSTASGNNNMWEDLEAGIIRQGPCAIYNPITLEVQPQEMWARPGLSVLIPVDAAGEVISVMDLFDIAFSGNYYAPFDGFEKDWIYGDGSPVEQAWMSTSAYAFSVQEFLYLMRPGPYGELMFDTIGTELSPGMITVPTSADPVMSSINWQYVQNDLYVNDDPFFEWMRPKNADQLVHAESVDGIIQIRFGYQRWISDRILLLGKNVSSTFGQKVRTLDVNLANKLAGFTNKDTTNMYLESIAAGATTNSLIIPSTNFDVFLHKSPVVDTYVYSGIIIRALADGTFVVYGYDLLHSEFTVFDRSTAKIIDVTVGGTPAPFHYFTPGATYVQGDIVRYNGVFYMSLVTQEVQKFEPSGYQKLKALPIIGGVSVSYKPESLTTITKIPYGSILRNAQEVFDLMIGWGAWLASRGWKFDEVNKDTNLLSDWLGSAKQFLFWLNSDWAPDASIQLSPLANRATLEALRGYPEDVESMSNGVYSILDKFGVAIQPNGTTTDREGVTITVEPADLASGGIYFLQVNTTETEHILIFDNTTNFNDVVYSPLLRARQQRLRFNGFRSNGWFGKMEAPGYLVIEDQLVPNYDSIVDAMRYYYDPNVPLDNPSLEDLGRHLIGYESKSYLDNLQVSNDVQYLFYQGAIRQKGTSQVFEKLFRSTKVQSDEIIEVFEEWALKLGDFGNTVEQVSTEFILDPEQNTGEVIVARMNYVPSTIGVVRLINIVNAENVYLQVPRIVISMPDADPLDPNVLEPLRQAKAYAVLDSAGRISRVEIIDQGYGYLSAPDVDINSGSESNDLDKLYSVWQGVIVRDPTLDNIVNIDIDQVDKWIVRPTDTELSLEFPLTDRIDYPLPNAGYVNFNDVDWTSFDVTQTAINWGTSLLNPKELDTIWVAKTFTEDWNVYKLVNAVQPNYIANTWKITQVDGEILLLSNYSLNPADNVTFIPQLWNSTTGERTEFGNMIVLQQVVDGIPVAANNFTVGFIPWMTTDYNAPGVYTDPDTLIDYNAYNLVTLDGTPITINDMGDFEAFTTMLLYKSMRWQYTPVEPLLPVYVGLEDLIWVDDVDGKWAVFKIQADPGFWDITGWDMSVIDFWSPNYGWDVTGPMYFNPYRFQGPLINTSLFESASVFGTRTGTELIQLPVYDPFKNILPGPAKQNISYTSMQDPARYNVTSEIRLFSENITFGPKQVGQLWWDLSSTRYVYYEQPISYNADGTPAETEVDNLIYRRDHWGQIFPGSRVDIYEWVQSDVVPELYTGTGTPRDITTYVQIVTSNRFTNATEIKYYFWVLNTTDLPNVENRTMPALDVSRLLQTPKSQGFAFFSPIQQEPTNNSYMFYNVQEILAYQGNNIQIQYRLTERDDQEHTQWQFFREGDPNSIVTDQYWNKMVDSLCAWTKVLPISDEWLNGIYVGDYIPWDIIGWDITAWDMKYFGEILPVPDPTLSEAEKYGIEYRPRQGMFIRIHDARKVFVQSANELLSHIPIRDDNPGWNAGVTTDDYWVYTNWYEVGYEDAIPTIVFATLADANIALTAGQLQVGTILQVTNGTIDGRFVMYSVVQLNPNIPVLSLEEVAVENSAIKLLDTIYTSVNLYGMSVELRQLLDAFRTQVMVDEFLVDQNELFFAMTNYVLSEQRNPDWIFKTSYIYIKENNVPLSQDRLYVPDEIDNIIDFIKDVKPYHTQIRDYTSTYITSDIAAGTAFDSYKINTVLTFGPDNMNYVDPGHWDADCNDETLPGPWDGYAWDVCPPDEYILNAETFIDNIEQFVSREDVYTVPLTFFDATKIGLSELFPYTFDFSSINLNDPQTFITPESVVGVQVGTTVLLQGQDFYVEYNVADENYTVYFYNDPGSSPAPVALVWFDGGGMLHFRFNTVRNEVAYGFPSDTLVVNVDTQLPANDVGGVIEPLVGWGDVWDSIDADTSLGEALVANGAVVVANPDPPFQPILQISWDAPYNPVILPNTISSKERTNARYGVNFYRNAERYMGSLAIDLPAPSSSDDNIQVITVFVDPLTHPITTDILPDPDVFAPGVIWIGGERIEYRMKTLSAPNTWELQLVRRGTMGTAPDDHTALIPSSANPLIFVPNPVWVEKDNLMPMGSDVEVWNASILPASPDLSTETEPGKYTSIQSVPLGGLWYAITPMAGFLRDEEGNGIP